MTVYAGEPPIEHQENFDRLVRQEELILEATEKLTLALDEAGITRTELAARLGRTPGYVSQVFGGGRNLTLRTVADIAAALSMRPTLMLAPENGATSNGLQWTYDTRGTRRWRSPSLEPRSHSLGVITDPGWIEEHQAAA